MKLIDFLESGMVKDDHVIYLYYSVGPLDLKTCGRWFQDHVLDHASWDVVSMEYESGVWSFHLRREDDGEVSEAGISAGEDGLCHGA